MVLVYAPRYDHALYLPAALVAFTPSLQAIEDFVRAHFVVTDHPHPSWPLILLERRR